MRWSGNYPAMENVSSYKQFFSKSSMELFNSLFECIMVVLVEFQCTFVVLVEFECAFVVLVEFECAFVVLVELEYYATDT